MARFVDVAALYTAMHTSLINVTDTPLTRAISEGRFSNAEEIIMSNTEEGYLDEGSFDRIPLAIVLFGDYDCNRCPRHLRLAKLLVEKGANPNLSVPMRPFQGILSSPMESLVDFYYYTRELSLLTDEAEILAKSEQFGNILGTIGLHNEQGLSPLELKEQILELLDVFIAYGGNPNIVTCFSQSTLYHIVMLERDPDVNIILKLCEAGGDLNRGNAHGTTPLMDLVTHAELDGAFHLLLSILEINPDLSSLGHENCRHETAFWCAMLSGSPQVALALLEKGADPSTLVEVTVTFFYAEHYYHGYSFHSVALHKGLPAFFAPLLNNSAPYLQFGSVRTSDSDDPLEVKHGFHVDLLNKVISSTMSPIIDNTSVYKLITDSCLSDLETIIEKDTRFSLRQLTSQTLESQDIMGLMFGNLKAGLQQLCVRQIVRQVLLSIQANDYLCCFKQTESEGNGASDDVEEVFISEKSKLKFNVDQWCLVKRVTPSAIEHLVRKHLELPSGIVKRFFIEMARLQVGASLVTLKMLRCIHACDIHSNGDDVDPDLEEDLSGEEEEDDDEDSSWFSESSQYDSDSYEFGMAEIKAMNYFLSLDGVDKSSNSSSELTSSDDDDDDDDDDKKGYQEDKANTVTVGMKDKVDGTPSDNPNSDECCSSSAESVPHHICRSEYEAFNDTEFCSDTSSLADENVHPQNSP